MRPVSKYCSLCGVLKTHENTAIRTKDIFQSECRSCKASVMHIMGLKKKSKEELKITMRQHQQYIKRIKAVMKDTDTPTRDLVRKLL